MLEEEKQGEKERGLIGSESLCRVTCLSLGAKKHLYDIHSDSDTHLNSHCCIITVLPH